MRSVDRVMASMRLEEPDRVPIGETDYDLRKVSEAIGVSFCNEASTDIHARMCEIRRSVETLSTFIENLDLDIVPVSASPSLWGRGGRGIKMIDSDTWVDEWGAKYRSRDGMNWYVGPGLKDIHGIAELEPPDPNAPGVMDGPKLLVERFKGRRALAGSIPGPKMPYLARGIDGYNIDLYRSPSLAKKFMDMATRYNVEIGKRLIEVGVDFIVMTGDVAYNRGPIVSVKHFREVFVPAIREPARSFHKMGVPMVKHTDGFLDPILDDLINSGIDGLHSIEPLAGMDIGKVKAAYGDKICLWGNIDLSYTLSQGTEQEVAEEVKECIKAAAPGGGHILSSSNSYSSAARFENFRWMVRTGRKYGEYAHISS